MRSNRYSNIKFISGIFAIITKKHRFTGRGANNSKQGTGVLTTLQNINPRTRKGLGQDNSYYRSRRGPGSLNRRDSGYKLGSTFITKVTRANNYFTVTEVDLCQG